MAGRLPGALGLMLVLAVGDPRPVAAQTSQTATPAVWHSLVVPGGPEAATAALGMTTRVERWRVMLEIIRQLHSAPQHDEDATRRIVSFGNYLENAEAGPTAPGETIPLPLAPSVWMSLLSGATRESALFRAIATDRRAGLLYYGLASLDQATLRFFTTNPKLLESLYRDHAPVFATLGRGLRIANGEIQLPGNEPARALWQDLVGEPTSRPDRFIEALLARDNGRLAFFFDTLLHLSPERYRFALGLGIASTGVRAKQFQDLYRVFARSNPDWKLAIEPFSRPAFDPGLVLALIRVTDSGEPVGPAWRRFWETAFRVDAGALRVSGYDLGDLFTAPWITSQISLATPVLKLQRERLETLLFAQRVFGETAPAPARDVMRTVRAFPSQRALMLTLERIGADDPPLYAAAAARADAITNGPPDAVARTSIAQFQGALALIERMRSVGTLTRDAAVGLVESIVKITIEDSGGYAGAIADWIEEQLLPTLAGALGVDLRQLGAEEVLLRALAGRAVAAEREPTVEWEGIAYAVDPAGTELRRLRDAREKQRGNRLEAVLALARSAEYLRAATSIDALRAASSTLDSLPRALRQADPVSADGPIGSNDERVLARTLEEVRKVRDPAHLPRIAERSRELVGLADAHLADALVAIVYALSLGQPDGPAFLSTDVSRRHDFGFDLPPGDARSRMVWSIAEAQSGPGIPWHLTGSILGLDAALADMSLRRIATDSMPGAPRLSGPEARAFAQAIALMNPLNLDDDEMGAIAGSIRKGREVLKTLAADRATQDRAWVDPIARDGGPEAHPSVDRGTGDSYSARDAEIDRVRTGSGGGEWRLTLLPWIAANAPDDLATLFSLAELFWLGAPREIRLSDLRPWGTSALPSIGCLCLEFPGPQSWETFAGRSSIPLLALRLPDLKLRIAEALSELRLPATLARGTLEAATQDLLDEATPLHANDWFTIARDVQMWPLDRIEDYIASLTAVGPLIPASEHATRRDPR